ncbi:winged helix-turn-helix transcriptional regulator [Candidatus Pacearchaeota archaeon]|nr:winged helix-turn-helix transcriptional regulator [Candidatus Pacearchaeota archaeon]
MINKSILEHKHHAHITEEEIYDSYKIFFSTLVSESRLKIINLLRKGRKNVSEIMNELKMDQTAVSHDLARLKRCGFVLVEIDGKFRYYKLNAETIKPIMETIDRHMFNYCIHILREMKGGRNKK